MVGVTAVKGKKAKKNKGNLIFAAVIAVCIIVFAIPMYAEAEKRMELEEEISSLAEQSAEAAKYNSELKDRIKYSNQDEYIEKIAREKLNMVKPDEILFIDKNKSDS